MIEVTAAIIEKGGKVLIAKRKKGKHLAGYWEFPGGKINIGESAEECLIREIKEELGVTINVINKIGEITHDYPEKSIKLIGFTCEIISGSFVLIDHDEIKWIEIGEINNCKMSPADIPLIKKIKLNNLKGQ